MSEDTIDRLREVVTSPAVIAIAVLLGGLIAGRLLVLIIRPAFARLARRTAATWDDELVARLASPVSWLVATQALNISIPFVIHDPRAAAMAVVSVTVGTTLAVLWGAFRAIDVARVALEQRSWAVDRPASRSLLSIGGRFAKVLVLLIGMIVLLAQLGVSVGSLIAGLGIGGLAVALAAQKTVENLFGTVSIGIDQPMREGDFVRVGDTQGTVERIGLRSTRIRTLERTLVTIPNGELSNQRIETYAARDRIRLSCVIGLVYETTATQMQAVLTDFEKVLRDHPKIWLENVVVRFQRFADSSLDIEISAWFQTIEWREFQLIRQDVLLAFMAVIERHGTSIAFPTRTVHLPPVAASPGSRTSA